MTALLSIENLSLDIDTFDGPVRVLKGVSLTVNRGDTLGIVGESGSGKTVLVRTVLGLGPQRSRIRSGALTFDGMDMLAQTDKGWRAIRGVRISMIFQDPMTFLNPLFTVGKQISDVIAAHQKALGEPVATKVERRARAEELLEQVGILNPRLTFDQYPHQLSGGMRQRVLISMALSGRPDLLIADEPTTALDVTVQAQVLALINELVDRLGLTVIMISHDFGAIATIAKRCAVMYRGEVVEEGPTREVLEAPKHAYTRRLLDALPSFAPPDVAQVPVETSDGATALVEASRLSKHFGRGDDIVKAVDDVSFAVAPGEVLGIVGESGSGKSTLARLLLRLTEPTAGTVRFDGTALTDLAPEAMRRMRRHMQLVFQNPHSALNGRHTVGEAIAEPLRLQAGLSRREIDARVAALLDTVQLPRDFRWRYPHELSGGQKQRVCIARAVALNPKLLILDEPTSALDVSVQAQILDFLNELRREMDLTYIFVSHDLAVVREMCERVLVMRRGIVVEHGATERVFWQPSHEYTRTLVESGRRTSREAALQMA